MGRVYQFRGYPDEMRAQAVRLGLSAEACSASLGRFRDMGYLASTLGQIAEKYREFTRRDVPIRDVERKQIESLIRDAERTRDRIALAYATAESLIATVCEHTGIEPGPRDFGQIGPKPEVAPPAKTETNGHATPASALSGSHVSKRHSPDRAKG